ncbi:MAG: CAP domain-containing protein [Thermomicrobiales bacterium]|nr:CAP domain-containing protein [Thermomicrobiales bacterium]
MDISTDHVSPVAAALPAPELATPSRRGLVALFGGVLAAGLATLPGAGPAAGKKKRHKGKGRKGKKGKGKKGGNGKGSNGNGGGTNPPPPPPPSLSVEEQLLELINAHRDDNGRAPLLWDDRLSEAAQNHSDDMTAHKFSSHTGSNGSSVRDRLDAVGYPASGYWGENIYQSAPNDPSAQAAFTWWKNSDGHNANMLSTNFTRIGIGQATDSDGITRWTTDFGSAA